MTVLLLVTVATLVSAIAFFFGQVRRLVLFAMAFLFLLSAVLAAVRSQRRAG
jgi:phage-related holin